MLVSILYFAVTPALLAKEHALIVAEPSYRSITLTGFTRARASLRLVAENAGRVLEVMVDIGDTVPQDGLFARIDPRFIELDLQANRIQQKQLIDRNTYDRQEAARHRELLDKGSASQSLYDQLRQTLRDNGHRLQELQIQEQVLQEKLLRTRVLAPSGWQVTQRQVEPGQHVSMGAVIGKVADYSTLLLPLALDPTQFASLRRLGAEFSVNLPDWQRRVKARIYRVNPGFDPQTRKINLDLALFGDLPERRGGLRASLRLELPEQTNAVLVPGNALQESYDEFWLTRENGERLSVVRLGLDSDSGWVRVSGPGIQPGDRFRLGGKD